jgi:superfamily II DNA or RNA helicase
VHREELLKSARNTLYNGFGIQSESIVAGKRNIGHSKVYVAMVETINNVLKKREAWSKHIGLIIVDECHIANFNKIYDYFDHSLILGFTATPIAASKKDPLKNYFDGIVTGPQINELIDMGSLCENVTYGIKGIDTRNFGVKRGEFDYNQMGNEFSKSRNVNNCVAKYLEKGEGKKAIVFNCNIEHSKLVNEAFINAGLNSKHIDGTESSQERAKIFEWFKKNDDAILNNVGIATTGFDEPSIINVIVNRSTMSMPLWLQMCGRGSRPYSVKEYFNIIDLGGNTKLHGDWRAYRNWQWIFNNPDKPSDGNGLAPIKNCEKCEAMIPAQSIICKYCGHEHIRVINYDQMNLELELIIGRINVASKHRENSERGYKDFKTFFDILNTTFAILKNHNPELINDEFKSKQYIKFLEKVKEWCILSKKPYSKFIQNFAKEQFDKKYLESKKLAI